MELTPQNVHPVSPDPFIIEDEDMMLIRLGHYKALVTLAQSKAGGAPAYVTQTGAITNTVRIDSLAGVITTVAPTIVKGTRTSFTVTNTEVTKDSVVLITGAYALSGGSGTPLFTISNVTDGSFVVNIMNVDTSSDIKAAMKVHFMVQN